MTTDSLSADLKQLVIDLTHGYGESHNFEHAEKVAANAAKIYSAIKDDILNLHQNDAEKVVISAAWLHDVLDHKMISDPDEYSRKEKLMREFLVARFSEEQVNLIFDIISNVSYSKEVKGLKKDLGQYEVLRNIVSDADKLEAIGEAGVLRCYQYQAEVHPHLSTEQVVADMKQHCEDKLLRLYSDYIRTRPGKELGADLHKAVQDFHSGVTTLDQLLNKHSLNGA
ncbi:hypothetical protein ACHWQZ_G007158 [Mnemiopsis leidyi]